MSGGMTCDLVWRFSQLVLSHRLEIAAHLGLDEPAIAPCRDWDRTVVWLTRAKERGLVQAVAREVAAIDGTAFVPVPTVSTAAVDLSSASKTQRLVKALIKRLGGSVDISVEEIDLAQWSGLAVDREGQTYTIAVTREGDR